MWLFYARSPRPDAPYWPGRRWLAVVDAVAWPLVLAILLGHLPGTGGLVLVVTHAAAIMFAAKRAQCALVENHHYHFTTWRWGRALLVLLVYGILLRAVMSP